MKIWNVYGSEHSANLVMIGRFKDVASAKKAKMIIDEITDFMARSNDDYRDSDRYSEGALDLLKRIDFHGAAPSELEQFRYIIDTELKGSDIVITTDEDDISAYLKILVEKGARVEVFSAHVYPEMGKDPKEL